MMQTGRNDPCPCGSGKKYKKCCGNNKITPITYTPGEVDHFLKQVYQYALDNYIEEFEYYMAELYSEEGIHSLADEELDLLSILTAAYWLFETDNQKSFGIVDRVLQSPSWNARERRLLETWKREAVFSLFVLEEKDEQTLTATSLLDDSSYKTKIPVHSYETFDKEISFICLVPVQNEWYMFGVPYTAFAADDSETFDQQQAAMREFVNHALNQRPQEEPFMALLREHLMVQAVSNESVLPDIPGFYEGENGLTLDGERVLTSFFNNVDEDLRMRGGAEYAARLWHQYVKIAVPAIKKPAAYAAALEYYVSKAIYQLPGVTQKNIGEKYGVAPGTISSRSRELDEILALETDNHETDTSLDHVNIKMERMMFILTKELERRGLSTTEEIESFQQTFQIEDAPVHLWNQEDQRQLKMYDAMLATDPLTKKERIMEIISENSTQADAFLQLAELSEDPDDILAYTKQAVDAGRRGLGESFFDEMKGDFWGIIETRPFMRAMLQYGALLEGQNPAEAVSVYEEMLELNPDDNQGVRYLLLPRYLQMSAFQKAETLLHRYPEQSTFWLFHRAFLEYQKNGLSKKLEQALRSAHLANPYVLQYLHSPESIPDELTVEPTDTYSPGSSQEALILIDELSHLWGNEKDLMNFSEKIKKR